MKLCRLFERRRRRRMPFMRGKDGDARRKEERAALARILEEVRERERNHRRLARHIREKYLPDGVLQREYAGKVPRLPVSGCAPRFARASAWYWVHADGAEDARRRVDELEGRLEVLRGGAET